MKSPFPGMDPFLERHWQDVHSTFMVYAKQQLNEHLPAELLAHVEESLAVETDDGHRRVSSGSVQNLHSPGKSTMGCCGNWNSVAG